MDLAAHPQISLDFDGKTFEVKLDGSRLTGQYKRVYDCMADGHWRTLEEISLITGDPQASVSARLRDFRKSKFANQKVDRRPRGERKHGLFEYRIDRK